MDNLVRARFGGVLFGVCAAVAAAMATPAVANPTDDAEAVIKQGIEFRRQGRDREALAEFQRAARIQETPRVWAQIGTAQQALGMWAEANTHLTRALEHQTDEWIRKNRSVLESAQAAVRSHLGQIEVWGGPNGAEVQFDSIPAGKLPLVNAWLGFGEVRMTVTATGYTPVTRPVKIAPDVRVREHVELRELAPITRLAVGNDGALASSGEGGGGAGGGGTGKAIDITVKPDAPPAPPPSDVPIYRKWWFWTAAGVIVVGVGAGVYLLTRESQSCQMPPCDTI